MEQFSYTLPVEFSTNFADKTEQIAQTGIAQTGDSLFFLIAFILLAMATVFGFVWYRLSRCSKAFAISGKHSVGNVAASSKVKVFSIVAFICAILLLCSSAILFCKTAIANAQQEQFDKTKIVVVLDEATGQYTIQNTELKNVYPYIQLDTSSCEITPEASSVASLKNVNVNLSSQLAKGSFYTGKADGSEYVPKDLSVVKLNEAIDLNLALDNLNVQDALQLDGKTVFNFKLNISYWELFPYAEFDPDTGQLVFHYDDNYNGLPNQFILPIQIDGPEDIPWLTDMNPLLIKSVEFDETYSEKPIITSMSNFFNGCETLKTVDLTNLNSEKLTNCESTFEGCTNLEKILSDNKDFNETLTESEDMFKGCENLVGGNGSTVKSLGETDGSAACVDYEGHPGLFTYKNKEDMSHITYDWNFKSGTYPKIDTEQSIPLGEKFRIIIENPSVDFNPGYTFIGWSFSQSATQPDYYFGNVIKAENPEIVIYAVWTANTNTPYTVNHYKQDLGKDTYTLADTEQLKGTTDTEVTPDTRPTTTEGEDNFYGFTAPEKQTVTIKGDGSTVVDYKYTRNTYHLQFNVNNERYKGLPIEGQEYLYEDKVNESSIETVKVNGYGFAGWYKTEECKDNEKWDFEKDVILRDTTLYAKWDLYTYTIKAHPNAQDAYYGDVDEPKKTYSYTVESGPIDVEDMDFTPPQRTAYQFCYWSAKQQNGEEFETLTPENLASLGVVWDSPEQYCYLFATWKPAEFTIDFYNVDPETSSLDPSSPVVTKKYTYNEVGINTSEVVAKEEGYDGYTFAGWFAENSVIKIEQINSYNIVSLGCNLDNPEIHGKIYSHWTPNTYTVNANICDGQYKDSGVEPVTTSIQYTLKNEPTPTNLLTTPYKAGYTFDGWYTKENDGEKIEEIDAGKLNDVGCDINDPIRQGTLYAHFTPNTYTIDAYTIEPVSHNLSANEEPQTITYTTGTDADVAQLTSPERTGYKFMGWFDKETKGTEVTLINLSNIENLGCNIDDPSIPGSIYSQWKSLKYTVNFEAYPKDGSCLYSTDSQIFLRGEAQQLNANNFYREGFTFDGWSETLGGEVVYKNCEEVIDIAEDEQPEVTLYPHWANNTYDIKFDKNNGDGTMDTQTGVQYHTEIDLPVCTFTRVGYEFDGWAKKPDGNVLYSDKETVKDIEQQEDGIATLYAHWTPIKYYVAFHANGGNGEMPNQEFTYDALPQNLSAGTFTVGGKHLLGWAEVPNGEKKYNDQQLIEDNLSSEKDSVVDLYAVYETNTYKVEFKPNGASWSETDMHKMDFTYGVAQHLTQKPIDDNYKNPITDKKSYKFIKDGCLFDGWALSADGDVVYSDNQEVINLTEEHDTTVTLYAHWTKAESLIFDYNSTITGGEAKTYWYHPLVDDSIGLSGITFYQANGVEIPKTNNNGTAYKMEDLRYATQYTGSAYFKAFREYNIGFSDAFGIVAEDGYAENWIGSGHYKPDEDTCETLNLSFKGKTGDAQNASIANIDIENILIAYFKDETSATSNAVSNFYGRYAAEANKGVTLSFNSGTTITSSTWQYDYSLETANVLFSRNFNTDSSFNGKITFDKNVGDGTATEQPFNSYKGTFKNNSFARTGYAFEGWSLTPNGIPAFADQENVYMPFVCSGQNVTLYACWKANTYTVEFWNKTGTEKYDDYTQSFTYDVEQALSCVTVGLITGHTHIGWSKTSAISATKDFDKQQLVKNLSDAEGGIVKLYAYYKTNTFNIEFCDSAGAALDKMPVQEMVYASDAPLNAHIGDKVGYTFEGWATSLGGSKVYDDKSTACSTLKTDDGVTLKLYEVYTPIEYTLKFDYNGVTDTYDQLKSQEEGSNMQPYLPACTKSLKYNEITTLPSMEKKWLAFEDQFLGWTLDPNKSTPDYEGGQTVSGLSVSNSATVTLYACWKYIPSLFADKTGTDEFYPAGGWIKYIDHININKNVTNSYYSSFLYRPITATGLDSSKITFYTLQKDKPQSYNDTGWTGEDVYDNYTKIEPSGNNGIYTMDDLKCATNYSGSLPFKAMRVVSCPEYDYNETSSQGHWWWQYENADGVGGLDLEKAFEKRNQHYKGVFQSANEDEICENIQYSGSSTNKTGVFNKQAKEGEKLYVIDAKGESVYLYPNGSNPSFTSSYCLNFTGKGIGNNFFMTPSDETWCFAEGDGDYYSYPYVKAKDLTSDYATETLKETNLCNLRDGQLKNRSLWLSRTFNGGEACSVTYNSNPPAASEKDPETKTESDWKTGALRQLTKNPFNIDKYAFVSWNTAEDGTGTTYYDEQSVSFSQNVILYAQWKDSEYTINFWGNGGKLSEGQTQPISEKMPTYESKALTPNAYTNSPLLFQGWAESPDGDVMYKDKDFVRLSEEDGKVKDLYAVWGGKYTVNFDENGASSGSINPQEYNINKWHQLPDTSDLIKTGYTFLGWSQENTASEPTYKDKEYVLNLPYDDNFKITLYAVWKANEYSVKFEANGGVGNTKTQDFVYDVSQNLSSNTFTKTGYHFGHWVDAKDLTKTYSNEQNVQNLSYDVKGEVTLNAFWVPNSYKVRFNGNGSTAGSMNDEDFTYDTPKTLTTCGFTKTGYNFIGWSTTDKGNVEFTNSQEVNNLTEGNGNTVLLYACWSPRHYQIQFDATTGTGVMGNQTFTYDEHQSLNPCNFTKEGYHFVGWEYNAETYDDEVDIYNLSEEETTLVFKAKWEANSYKVVFHSNRAPEVPLPETKEQQLIYDRSDNLQDNTFSWYGYDFIGWSTSSDGDVVYQDGAPVLNLTSANGGEYDLYAQWKYVKYVVHYDLNGAIGEMPDQDFMHGHGGTLNNKPTDVVKGNDTFLGWSHTQTTLDGQAEYADGATITSDLTDADEVRLYAIWQTPADQSFTITIDLNGGTVENLPIDSGWTVSSDTSTIYTRSFNGKTDISRIASYWNALNFHNNDNLVADTLVPFSGIVQTSTTLNMRWGMGVIFHTERKADEPKAQLIEEGGTAHYVEPINVLPEYKFVDWYSDPNYKNWYDFDLPVYSTIHLYAKFVSTEEVKINLNDGIINGDEKQFLIDKGWTENSDGTWSIRVTYSTKVEDVLDDWRDINPTKKDSQGVDLTFYNWDKTTDSIINDIEISAIWGYTVNLAAVKGSGSYKFDYSGNPRQSISESSFILPAEGTTYKVSGYGITFTWQEEPILSIKGIANPTPQYNQFKAWSLWTGKDTCASEDERELINFEQNKGQIFDNDMCIESSFGLPQLKIYIDLDGGSCSEDPSKEGWSFDENSNRYYNDFVKGTSVKVAIQWWTMQGSQGNITKNSDLYTYTYQGFDVKEGSTLLNDCVVKVKYEQIPRETAKCVRTSDNTINFYYDNKDYSAYQEVFPINNSSFNEEPGSDNVMPPWQSDNNGVITPLFKDYLKITNVYFDDNFKNAKLMDGTPLTSVSAWLSNFPELINAKVNLPSTITDASYFLYNSGKVSNNSFDMRPFDANNMPDLVNVYKMFAGYSVYRFYVADGDFAPKATSLASLFKYANINYFNMYSYGEKRWGSKTDKVNVGSIFFGYKGAVQEPMGCDFSLLYYLNVSNWCCWDEVVRSGEGEGKITKVGIDLFASSNVTSFSINYHGIGIDSPNNTSCFNLSLLGFCDTWQYIDFKDNDTLVDCTTFMLQPGYYYLSAGFTCLGPTTQEQWDKENRTYVDVYSDGDHVQEGYIEIGKSIVYIDFSCYRYKITHDNDKDVDVFEYNFNNGAFVIYLTPDKGKQNTSKFKNWEGYKDNPDSDNIEYVDLIADGQYHLYKGDLTINPVYGDDTGKQKVCYEEIDIGDGKTEMGLCFYNDNKDHSDATAVYDIKNTFNNDYPDWYEYDEQTKSYKPKHQIKAIKINDGFDKDHDSIEGMANWFHDMVDLYKLVDWSNLNIGMVVDTQSLFENTSISQDSFPPDRPFDRFFRVENAKYMYKNTKLYGRVDVYNLGTSSSKASDFTSCFANNDNIETFVSDNNIGPYTAESNYQNMLENCSNLQITYIDKCNIKSGNKIKNIVKGSNSLKQFCLGDQTSAKSLGIKLSDFGVNSGTWWINDIDDKEYEPKSTLNTGNYYMCVDITLKAPKKGLVVFYDFDSQDVPHPDEFTFKIPWHAIFFKWEEDSRQIAFTWQIGEDIHTKFYYALSNDPFWSVSGWSCSDQFIVESDMVVNCYIGEVEYSAKALVYKDGSGTHMKFVYDSLTYPNSLYPDCEVYPVRNSYINGNNVVPPSWIAYDKSSGKFTPICSQPDDVTIDFSMWSFRSYKDENGKDVKFTGVSAWFAGMKNIKSFKDLGYVYSYELEDMSYCFYETSSNTDNKYKLILDDFDGCMYWVSNYLKNASHMFAKCGFWKVDLPSAFFQSCQDVSELFRESKISTFSYRGQFGYADIYGPINLANMFRDCKKLASVILDYTYISPERVSSQAFMFYGCSSLKLLRYINGYVWISRSDANSWRLHQFTSTANRYYMIGDSFTFYDPTRYKGEYYPEGDYIEHCYAELSIVVQGQHPTITSIRWRGSGNAYAEYTLVPKGTEYYCEGTNEGNARCIFKSKEQIVPIDKDDKGTYYAIYSKYSTSTYHMVNEAIGDDPGHEFIFYYFHGNQSGNVSSDTTRITAVWGYFHRL